MAKEVFVFGSNLGGRHGAGSALEARIKHGAQYGVGFGPTGDSYAIPTKGPNFEKMSVAEIDGYVDTFLDYAKQNPDITFNIVAIGTGLAGHTDDEMGPLFKGAPSNCILPPQWEKYR